MDLELQPVVTIRLNAKKQTDSDISLVKQSLTDSGTNVRKVCYQGVQLIVRDLRENNTEDLYPHFFFFLFWSGRAVALIVIKYSDQIHQYLGVRGVISMCWDHVWHDG